MGNLACQTGCVASCGERGVDAESDTQDKCVKVSGLPALSDATKNRINESYSSLDQVDLVEPSPSSGSTDVGMPQRHILEPTTCSSSCCRSSSTPDVPQGPAKQYKCPYHYACSQPISLDDMDDVESQNLANHIGQVDRALLTDHLRCSHIVLGTPLSDHRDPLRGNARIRTGVLDVNGSGTVDCADCHDAIFLNYPVTPEPVPNNSAQEFTELQKRYQTINAIEHLQEDGGVFFREDMGVRYDDGIHNHFLV